MNDKLRRIVIKAILVGEPQDILILRAGSLVEIFLIWPKRRYSPNTSVMKEVTPIDIKVSAMNPRYNLHLPTRK